MVFGGLASFGNENRGEGPDGGKQSEKDHGDGKSKRTIVRRVKQSGEKNAEEHPESLGGVSGERLPKVRAEVG